MRGAQSPAARHAPTRHPGLDDFWARSAKIIESRDLDPQTSPQRAP
jgi:hypothetical protein